MIESLLIANRGEIASRIIRTARRMGVRTIAAYSSADADAPFVKQADWRHRHRSRTGARELFVRRQDPCRRQIERRSGYHPANGFLSENAEFADAVLHAGLIWVGAPPAAIRAMGLKDAAKA